MASSALHTLTDEVDGGPARSAAFGSDVLYLLLEGDRPTASSACYSLARAQKVLLGRGTERRGLRPAERDGADLQVEVPDARMSSQHAVLSRSADGWLFTDSQSRNGSRINGQRVESQALRDGDLLELGRTLFLFRRELTLVEPVDRNLEASAQDPFQTLNQTYLADLDQLRRLAPAREVSILIQGESGTGKELLARRIAEWARLKGDFVAVNCGALPASLLEGELFGAVRGAYSGATTDRLGLVRSADKGCLFLDEIAELAPASQAALLRVLQEQEVVPLGATRPIAVTLRVVSATHQDLDVAVALGRFRHDLLARVAGFRVRMPPLRERREDIGVLIASLLLRSPSDMSEVRLGTDFVRALYAYDWPLNVRELSNVLRTSVLLAQGDVVTSSHLKDQLELRSVGAGLVRRGESPLEALTPEQAAQREELLELLKRNQGNVSAVAREMGKARMQIQRWMKRYGFTPEQFRQV